jgi:hypothetical protein
MEQPMTQKTDFQMTEKEANELLEFAKSLVAQTEKLRVKIDGTPIRPEEAKDARPTPLDPIAINRIQQVTANITNAKEKLNIAALNIQRITELF